MSQINPQVIYFAGRVQDKFKESGYDVARAYYVRVQEVYPQFISGIDLILADVNLECITTGVKPTN